MLYSFIRLFEQQALINPNAIAVYNSQSNLHVDYESLNLRANKIACYINKLGVKKGDIIGVVTNESLDTYAIILAVLKLNAIILPLDINYPNNYLEFVIQNTKLSYIISGNNIPTRFRKNNIQIVNLEPFLQKINLYTTDFQSSKDNISYHNPIYIIYTSGSTGKPKGVILSQGAIAEFLAWEKNYYKEYIKERVLQFSALNFDIFFQEFFATLSKGSTLVSVPILYKKRLDDLLKFICTYNINKIMVTCTVLSQIAEYAITNNKHSKHLKKIINVGESLVLTSSLILFIQNMKHCKFYNLYGAAENQIISIHELQDYDSLKLGPTPIGKATSNNKIYILDEHLNQTKDQGMLCIASNLLCTGYLNRPDLIAEKFIPNPFGSGDRLYKTGDIVRYMPDGNIEFLGRADDQVKIRGFRIELGAIESVMIKYKDVYQAVVLTHINKLGNTQLIAYIVPQKYILQLLQEDTSLFLEDKIVAFSSKNFKSFIKDLKEHLHLYLPDYMVPNAFVFIDKLLFTASGKINKNALPKQNFNFRQVDNKYVSPHSLIEKKLSNIWSEVFQMDKIGIHDNFFNLGGHSLLATQIISRIRYILSIELPLRSLFDSPTIAALAKEIEANTTAEQIPDITSVEKPEHIPLSFAQNRLWFLDQLRPGTLYNVPMAFNLQKNVDVASLEKALNALIKRHESLRTIFPYSDGEASQLILPKLEVRLKKEVIDSESLEAIAKQEANTIFNLSKGPLLKVKLVTTAEETTLFITMHHIITDGWSNDIFLKELAILYDAYLKGAGENSEILPPLAVQYADFSLWQRQWLQGATLDNELSYWKAQLTDIPEILELPTNKLRPKELSYKGKIYSITLQKDIAAKITSLSKTSGTSMFMTMMAIFQIFLYRITGQNDIVVGTPIAGRHYKEIEGIIGFFINTLAIRTHFRGNETFTEILEKVRDTTLDGYKHQNLPFEQLVDHMKIARELNRNPVFQVMFTFDKEEDRGEKNNNSLIAPKTPAINFEDIYSVSKFDLSIYAYESNSEINIDFQYSTDLFEESTIKTYAESFIELTDNILNGEAKTRKPINAISIVPEKEKRKILIDWNATEKNYPKDQTIGQLFEQQVEKTPDSIAVVYEDKQLSYIELNNRANQLAHYLQRQYKLQPDALIALCLDRSENMLIAILAVLKSGAAYVPIDPSYPEERIKYILEDTKPKVVIANNIYQDKLESICTSIDNTTDVFAIDNPYAVASLASHSKANLKTNIINNHLAYVIYTSGTTGNPKGVAIEHKGVVNYILSIINKVYMINDHRYKFALLSTVAADIGNTTLYASLVTGGVLFIFAEKDITDTDSFIDIIRNKQIEYIKIVPSHFQALTSANNALPKLEGVIFGGDVLQKHLIDDVNTKNIINHYGPTETTIGCALYGFSINNSIEGLSIPIGRPIANTMIYILSRGLEPLPIGAIGEIYIGGAGLARGYLNMPDLTAERFIPNPFGTGDRIYKTGDLARYMPDGNIEYIGRNDFQVKIRGFRIELGEIESKLLEYNGIKQAAVLDRVYEAVGSKHLVGYYVSDIKLNEEDILQFLENKLPDYMVPSILLHLDKLPLTISGKLDRKALPNPEFTSKDAYTEPRNEIEKKVRDIWAEVLGLDKEKIGIYDNFFRLGGDSIISIQIASKARQQNIHFLVKDIFNYPTIAGISASLKNIQDEITVQPEQNLVQGDIPLTPIQHWFFERNLTNKNHYNQSVILQTHADIDIDLLYQVFDTLILHHDILRCQYHHSKKGWKQKNLSFKQNENIWHICDLSKIQDIDLPSQIELQANIYQQNLSIEKGPLIKIVLFNCGKKRQARLLIIIHHLIIDGVSWRILLEDCNNIYQALKNNQIISIPKKSHSYMQWSNALLKYSKSDKIKKHIAYWENIKKSIKPLPVDFNKEHNKEPNIDTITFSITKEETLTLIQKTPKIYLTQINDILLTALVLAKGDWTKDYTLSIALEGHGRENIIDEIDISRTIGWFTSVFPVYIKIDDHYNLEKSIKIVKETLNQIPNKGIDYAILKYLTPKVELSSIISDNTIYTEPSINFNYFGQWDNVFLQKDIFKFAEESTGNNIAKENYSLYSLNINSEIKQGVFIASFDYNSNHYMSTTIEKFGSLFISRLKEIISFCNQKIANNSYTLSDFQQSDLDFEEMQKRIKIIEES